MVRTGMVHGRFQPFTIGHMEYVVYALERADRLIVGITNPISGESEVSSEDDHRHLSSSNPYTYYERARMVVESVRLDSRTRDRVGDVTVVPLFLDDVSSWNSFFPSPSACVQYINLFDGWDEEKKSRFESYGYLTEDVGLPRIVSATEVRRMLDEGSGGWRSLVPMGTLKVLEGIAR